MGGSSSKKVTVGYKYYLGMHLILTHGPADKLLNITVDGRRAWSGASTGGRVSVQAADLFGGEKREGGVSGEVDLEMGLPTQGRNDYLQSHLGSDIPAFRGVVGVVLRQCYLGLNPYLKKWAFRLSRVHKRTGGELQWYDEKAEIESFKIEEPVSGTWPWVNRNAGNFVIGASEEYAGIHLPYNGWWHGNIDCFRITKGVARYATRTYVVPEEPFGNNVATDPHYSNVVLLLRMEGSNNSTSFVDEKGHSVSAFNGAKISTDRAKFGTSSAWFNGTNSYLLAAMGNDEDLGNRWTMEAWVWLESTRETSLSTYGRAIFGYGQLNIGYFDTAWFCNGDRWNYVQREGPLGEGDQPYAIQNIGPRAEVGRWAFVSVCFDGSNYWMHQDGQLLTGVSVNAPDMNPAHIIRECLTDPEWGMGYQETDIDDSSFVSAADKLYDEGFGISILWDRQTPIEDFVKEIIRHINAVLYVDRSTGKFSLKLIRGDYSEDSLLTLGPDQIDKVDNFSRPAFGELINSVTVNYWDGQTGKTASTTAQDTALVQMQGAVIGTTIQYPGCTNDALAGRLASRDLQTLSNPLLSCTIYADRTAGLLNIGDVFKLDWPDLLAAPVVMRVVGLAFGDGKTNKVKVTCTEDIFSLPQVGVVAPQPPVWEDPSTIPTPADVRVVIEAPYYELVQRMGQTSADELLNSSPETGYLLASARRPPGAINASLMVDAGAGYEDTGVVEFCPAAELSAPVGQLDTTLPITNADALDEIRIGSHLQLGEELVRVDSVGETSITVGRGVLDTVPAKHMAGTPLLAWDDYAEGDQVEYLDGETVGVRLLPVSGAGEVELSAAATDTLVMRARAARPYPPGNFKVDGSYFPSEVTSAEILVTWAHRDRKQQTGGSLIDFTDGDVGPEVGVTYRLDTYGIDHEGVETLIYSQPGLIGTSATVDLTTNAPPSTSVHVSIRLFSVRDGMDSLFPQRCDIDVLSAPFNLSATYEA